MSKLYNLFENFLAESEDNSIKVFGLIENEFLKYHVENNMPLYDPIVRPDSEEYYNMMIEAKQLYLEGKLSVTDRNKELLSKLDIGKPAIYKDKKVKLDSPKRINYESDKKFFVFVDSGKVDKESGLPIAKKIEWGDPNLSIKNYDEKAAASFQARHQCHLKNDKTTPGFWACHIHLFAKSLGLSSNRPW
jgi:hypothetical protein